MQQIEKLNSYSRLHKTSVEVIAPKDIAQLISTFAQAHEQKRRIALRGSGYSLDAQAISTDLVVSLRALDAIKHLDREKRQITVEGGARWGDILKATLAEDLVPLIMPSTGLITAAGSLSSNTVSRSTPIYGKEGRYVTRLSLLTPTGELLECSRTQNQELFHAVIGGFGYFGVITELTMDLLALEGRKKIETIIHKVDGFDNILDILREDSHPDSGWDAVCAAGFCKPHQRGMIFHSKFTTHTKGKRHMVHRPRHIARVPAEWMMRSSRFSDLAWSLIYRFFTPQGDVFLDEIEGYSFFFDANRRAKRMADAIGLHWPMIQHGFVVPADSGLDFILEASRRLALTGISPKLLDILYIPADPFLLSASYNMDSFAFTYSFEDLGGQKFEKICAFLSDISNLCGETGGRLWLTKNVLASAECTGQMFRETIPTLLELKQRVDPHDLIHNEFFEKIFSHHKPLPASF